MEALINKIITELEYKKLSTRPVGRPISKGDVRRRASYLRGIHNLALQTAQKIVWEEYKLYYEPIKVEPRLKDTHYLTDEDLIYN